MLGADGGVPSQIPECEGTYFTLAPEYDLSAPQPTVDLLASSLLDGEIPTGRRSSNRTISLPVKITAPDRNTLAAAREILLALIDQDEWILTWTRDGGDPMIFDCFRAAPAVPGYDVLAEQQLVAYITVSFPAAPYGRSDDAEVIQFPSPSQNFDPPPPPVNIDIFSTATSFLSGDASTFETTSGGWVNVGSVTVARSTAQFHSGAASLSLTANSAATVGARHASAANYALGIGVAAGKTLNVRGFSRAATTARSVNVGASFWDENGTQVGSTLRGSNVTNSNANFNANPTAALAVPSGAVWALAEVQVVSAANGEVHYFDDITMDTGNVYSYNDPGQWSQSSVTAVTGHNSAKWTRATRDYPVYDHILNAPVDISGLAKFTFWLGLSTTAAQYATWHKGTVHFAITLTDAAGVQVKMSARKVCKASGIISQPHWQFVSVPIKLANTFDYTQLKRYSVAAWNTWVPGVVPAGATTPGQPVLQATAFLCEVVGTGTATGPATFARGGFFTFPGITGSARSPLALTVAPGLSAFSTVVTFTSAGSNAWTAPAGVTQVDKAEAWGGGGGGAGGSNNSGGGGGGGGGEYGVLFNIPVTAGNSYPFTVGAAGNGGSPGNPGTAGGDSSWTGNGGNTVSAVGGHPGWSGNVWGGGKGGNGGISSKSYPGGNGRQSNVNGQDSGRGGGGGSSAGTGAPGKDATGREGADAVTGGGPGGWGGGLPGADNISGNPPGTGPGGGGGGGNDNSGGHAGGNGYRGKGRLTYGATGILPLASLLLHTPGRDEPSAFNPLCPVGNGSDVPNGTTEYIIPQVNALNARFDGSYTCYLVASSWSSPGSSRTITVVIKQIPYSGGPVSSITLTRTVTPSTDLPGTTFYLDLNAVTLPVNALPPGNTSAEFRVTVQSSNTSDRFLDLLLLSSVGKTLLVNVSGSSIYQNIWVDSPDSNRALGLVLGSDADRDRAFSIAQYIERYSGGPMDVEPGIMNRLLVYSQQGCPGTTATYLPRFMVDRADR